MDVELITPITNGKGTALRYHEGGRTVGKERFRYRQK